MARRYGQVLVSIWNDEDWWDLTETEQRLYMLILSQPDMSYCGVVPLRLSKWSKLAKDSDPGKLGEALEALAGKRYVVIDGHHEEVWVRSFVRVNKVAEQEQLLKSLRSSYENISSQTIKGLVYDSVPANKRAEMRPPRNHPGQEAGDQGDVRLVGTLPGSLPEGSSAAPVTDIGVSDVSGEDLYPNPDLHPNPNLDIEPVPLTTPLVLSPAEDAMALRADQREAKESQSKGGGEKLRGLFDRLEAMCCAENRSTVRSECVAVIGQCVAGGVPLDLLERAIDELGRGKPVLPRSLVPVIQRHCTRRGVPSPLFAEIGKAAS